jgi:hypothetical protein
MARTRRRKPRDTNTWASKAIRHLIAATLIAGGVWMIIHSTSEPDKQPAKTPPIRHVSVGEIRSAIRKPILQKPHIQWSQPVLSDSPEPAAIRRVDILEAQHALSRGGRLPTGVGTPPGDGGQS